MRRLLMVFLFLDAAGCYSRRYFEVPQTEEAHWCLNYCVTEHMRCRDGHGGGGLMCQKQADTCLAGGPGARELTAEEAADAGY